MHARVMKWTDKIFLYDYLASHGFDSYNKEVTAATL